MTTARRPDPALIVVRLIDEARKKNDGVLEKMKTWLETRRSFLADEASTDFHDHAIDDVQNLIELDLIRFPIIYGPTELKAGMELIVNDNWNLVLTKDVFVDPKDNLLTVVGTKTDGTGDMAIAIDTSCKYMVVDQGPGLELS